MLQFQSLPPIKQNWNSVSGFAELQVHSLFLQHNLIATYLSVLPSVNSIIQIITWNSESEALF